MKLTPRIKAALDKAAVLHQNQVRKGDELPYIVHPYAVAFILANYTNKEDIIIAGLLHDVLEDVPGYGESEMTRDFGDKVCAIVKEVSEDKVPADNREKAVLTWQYRKDEYIKHLRSASHEALMVSCADKIENLNSMILGFKNYGDEFWKRFNAPKDRLLWFYGAVLGVLKDKLTSDIVKELEQTHDDAIKFFT